MHRQLHDRFHALHGADAPLLIANAWEAGSAALWQRAGAPAIGTSSAALAWSCGYADGGGLDPDALLQRVRDVVRVTSMPVTIDVEDGYSDSPEATAAPVREVADADAGAAGLQAARQFLDGDTARGFHQARGYGEFNQLFAIR